MKSGQKSTKGGNPDFRSKSTNYPKKTTERDEISLLLGLDSSTSTTMETEEITVMEVTSDLSEDSDETEASETIYKPITRTGTGKNVCQNDNFPDKSVTISDTKFPFTQNLFTEIRFEESPAQTHTRAKSRSITCKGSSKDLNTSRASETSENT